MSARVLPFVRRGTCVCSNPVAAHFGPQNEFVSCDQPAQTERGPLVISSQTTFLILQDLVDDAISEGQRPDCLQRLRVLQRRLHDLTGEDMPPSSKESA